MLQVAHQHMVSLFDQSEQYADQLLKEVRKSGGASEGDTGGGCKCIIYSRLPSREAGGCGWLAVWREWPQKPSAKTN